MTVTRSDKLINQGFAPGLATFVRADIPSLTADFPQAAHWIANHLLNSMYGASFGPKAKPVVLAFIRRAHLAFSEFHRARETTLAFLAASSPGAPSVMMYYDAIAQWEAFVLQACMAIDLFNSLNPGEKAFQKNDGSKEQRLHTLGNQIKHTASCVESGEFANDDLVPLWLTEAGLNSFGVIVSYSEAAGILADIGRVAGELEDPKSFVERRRARQGEATTPAT